MTPLTLVRFLLGRRDAIEALAADRRTFWIGLLLVFSAALAREYNGEDLLAEPWYLFIPLVVSTVAALLVFAILFWDDCWDWNRGSLTEAFGAGYQEWQVGQRLGLFPLSPWPAYRYFLGLFWMTAPLAWLYAIPYERFLNLRGAMAANLATLAVVAGWRVALILRVGVVLCPGFGVTLALRLLLVASGLTFAAAFLTPPGTPFIVEIMGGIRSAADEAWMQGVTGVVLTLSLLGIVVGGPGVLVWARRPTVADLRGWLGRMVPHEGPSRGAWSLLVLALAALLVWIPILPHTQPEQVNRRRAERLHDRHELAAMLEELSAHQPQDYPPHWPLPPRRGGGWPHGGEALLEIVEAMAEAPVAPWVRARYLERLNQYVRTVERFNPTLVRETGPFPSHSPERLAKLHRLKAHFGDELYLPLPPPRPEEGKASGTPPKAIP